MPLYHIRSPINPKLCLLHFIISIINMKLTSKWNHLSRLRSALSCLEEDFRKRLTQGFNTFSENFLTGYLGGFWLFVSFAQGFRRFPDKFLSWVPRCKICQEICETLERTKQKAKIHQDSQSRNFQKTC